ncbi:MAG: hypothetical protein JWM32_1116 [Verrucomicrobia bacterium]|nr:hypothetical protein [Verrucomicrobiota bacterium]
MTTPKIRHRSAALAKSEGSRLLQYFLRGLIVVVPVALTFSIIYWVFDRIDGILRPYVETRGMGLALILVFIVAVGWVSSFFLIKRIFRTLNGWLEHTPVVNFIYSSLRDFLEAFAGKKRRFTHAVLVSVLADDVWLVGFLTDEDLDGFKLGSKFVSVYVPQAYNVAGQLYLVKRERIRPIDHLSPPEVMKYAVSGGAVELMFHSRKKTDDEPAPVA